MQSAYSTALRTGGIGGLKKLKKQCAKCVEMQNE